ncbi:MAG: hypothetical protein RL264_1413 [Bacteroidota bacterium]|jgi:RNA polymerase sigma-70 factor (ECF subfamily)
MNYNTIFWNQYLDGDNEALAKLYPELFEPFVLKAIYYTKNPEAARDIVSSLFVYLLEQPIHLRKERWEEHTNFEFLLLAIVKNKCLDYLKIEGNRERIKSSISEYSIENETVNVDLIHHLHQCVQMLKKEEKELIELHLKGFSNQEISSELNLNEKTVRNKLSLSRKAIFKIWARITILIVLLWI